MCKLNSIIQANYPSATVRCDAITNPLLWMEKRQSRTFSMVIDSFKCTCRVTYVGRMTRCLPQTLPTYQTLLLTSSTIDYTMYRKLCDCESCKCLRRVVQNCLNVIFVSKNLLCTRYSYNWPRLIATEHVRVWWCNQMIMPWSYFLITAFHLNRKSYMLHDILLLILSRTVWYGLPETFLCFLFDVEWCYERGEKRQLDGRLNVNYFLHISCGTVIDM